MQQSFAKWWHRAPVCLGFSVNAQSMTLVEWCRAGLAQAPLERWAQEAWAPGEKQDGKPGLSAWYEPSLRLSPTASPLENSSGPGDGLRSGGFGLAFGAPFSG